MEKRKKRKINLSKTDKLKYIDQLTSLKNRAYLNSKIDAWDNSEVYPQSIITIDLNNISYSASPNSIKKRSPYKN